MNETHKKLEETRKGYLEESCWQRLLLDAYLGSGGFQGRVKQPEAGFWGEAAEAYAGFSTFSTTVWTPQKNNDADESKSYLDRYPREDTKKFARRVQVSYYLNYVKPTTNLKISYIMRKPHKRNNLPKALADWMERTKYDDDFRRRALLTAVLGYFFAFVDKPKAPPEAKTAAQAGNMDPYIVDLMPCHALKWMMGADGKMDWFKSRAITCEQPKWNSETVKVTRYTVLTRTDIEVWEARGDDEPVMKGTTPHSMTEVPVVSWRTDASVESDVKADSINAEIVPAVRRLFNVLSELDENLRGTVFSLIIVPEAGTQIDGGGDNRSMGTENGLTVDPNQKNVPFYLAPPPTVAETYEKRIEKLVVEIYRMARVEYAKAEGSRTSAQSKEANFEQTNLSIVDFATSLAKSDRDTLILVGRALGIAEDELRKIECVPHESYATEELNEEIDQVISAATLSLGNTAKGELLKRLVWRMLPNLGAATRAKIESEIDDAVVKAEKERELAATAIAGTDSEDAANHDGEDSNTKKKTAPPNDNPPSDNEGES